MQYLEDERTRFSLKEDEELPYQKYFNEKGTEIFGAFFVEHILSE